jgi:hypothetical protein
MLARTLRHQSRGFQGIAARGFATTIAVPGPVALPADRLDPASQVARLAVRLWCTGTRHQRQDHGGNPSSLSFGGLMGLVALYQTSSNIREQLCIPQRHPFD